MDLEINRAVESKIRKIVSDHLEKLNTEVVEKTAEDNPNNNNEYDKEWVIAVMAYTSKLIKEW